MENLFFKKRILIVEDSKFTSVVLTELLAENGYQTESVTKGEEAVQKVHKGVPLDLILMDIELAGEMNGIEAARKIIKMRDIPVVFLTANTSDKIIQQIKEVNAYGFIIKGTDNAAILSTVNMAIKLHEANIYSKMFQKLFENSLDEYYVFHPHSLKFVAVNKVARKNLGYSSHELKNNTFLDICARFNLESFNKIILSLLNGEQEQIIYNTLFRRKDGTTYPVEVNLYLFDYEGEKLCMAFVVDLTESLKIRNELEEKEMTLSALMDSVQDGIIMFDAQGKLTFWNPAAEKIFGYKKEEILGKDLSKLLFPDDRLYEVYTKAFNNFEINQQQNNLGKTIEMKGINKKGYEFDIEISLSELKTRNSWYAVGIIRDISERKQAQEELENSRKQYLELAEEAPIGILKCDAEGNIIYVNEKALQILGSPSALETKKVNLLKAPSLVAYGFSEKLKTCLKENKIDIYEMKYETIWKKKVWLRVHVKPLVEKHIISGAQLIIDDISEKKKMEEELRNLSVTDSLTQSYNRRYFTQKVEEEIERAERNGSKFSIIMLDIDHFKSINDRYGHNTGDLVLKSLVNVIKNRIRKIDILARWGGEEFVILLLDTNTKNAVFLAEKLRESISNMNVPGVDKVTASFGISTYCKGDTVDTIVNKADMMMYEAKSSGRNCVKY
ncbi:PAS domain S-box protein [Clostridium sp. SYSU_GA19001]|uniref:PAS domain S-box protein n=1 Tax=Clostridium caldaquaticum TaxID=2940653 RepID=UPI0020774480|nr:PAS domain S-box protein [Clostridium caldaquaticum]MCM8710271.1 PAS domain S-box protein [Clostridium caldaquaticum]